MIFITFEVYQVHNVLGQFTLFDIMCNQATKATMTTLPNHYLQNTQDEHFLHRYEEICVYILLFKKWMLNNFCFAHIFCCSKYLVWQFTIQMNNAMSKDFTKTSVSESNFVLIDRNWLGKKQNNHLR